MSHVGGVFSNHYEDGMEFAGVQVRVDEIEDESRHLAQKLGVTFQIRDIGAPG